MPAKSPSKTKSASARSGSTGAPANALVIVESPTKARTIKNFLPPGYTVTASVGHVRDLPRKAGEIPDDYKAAHKGKKWVNYGVNVDEGFEPLYIVTPDKKAKIRELKAQLKDADIVYLATDEDREGESISWHLLEVLKPKVDVKRMVFHEITREAIRQALEHPRDLDLNLVRAQETRRILDRLVGYAVSPILWNKVGGNGLSAGRVQSVALRLIVDRERERLAFKTGSYWDLTATLDHKGTFQAGMVSLAGKRLATGKDFDENTGRIAAGKDVLLLDDAQARALAGRLVSASWKVVSVEETPRTLKPYAPFTTSTLQQEANRKLRFSARRCMQVAQRLYENGFITYMRTDSIALSDQAITAAREVVTKLYGADHLPDSPRVYVNKVANAQEAHEAIRPAGSTFRLPEEVPLDGEELALYSLIWKRTVASQMKDAKKTGTTVEIAVEDARFRASGIRTDFAGFLRAYVEGSDDPEAALEDRDSPLPPLAVGDGPRCANLEPVGHETKPPARFTEATLVKALEENGIGRPSTYASILGTIQERGYVIARGQALVPTFVGFAVSDFLVRHFTALVDPAFTKKMEERLDDIAGGDEHWREYLEQFYGGATGLAAQVEEKSKLPATAGRTIELDGLDCEVKIGRFGAWVERKGPDGEVQKANLPDDATPADLKSESIDQFLRDRAKPPQSIGDHPETGEPIYLLKGQYGPYLQLGMPVPGAKVKPKRASLPKGVTPDQVTLEMAVGLLSLPRVLGTHPETGNVVKAGLGRFGPFVVHAKAGVGGKDEFRSLKAGDDPVTVTLERAVQLLAEPKGMRGQRGPVAPLREVGEHPSGGPVLLFDGRYGPYVKHGDLIASLPKEADAAKYTLEEAVTLLAERGKLPKSAKRARSASSRTTTAKGARKKTATKRTTRKS